MGRVVECAQPSQEWESCDQAEVVASSMGGTGPHAEGSVADLWKGKREELCFEVLLS